MAKPNVAVRYITDNIINGLVISGGPLRWKGEREGGGITKHKGTVLKIKNVNLTIDDNIY